MSEQPALFTRTEEAFSEQTPSEKRIGAWLLSHREQIPFEVSRKPAAPVG